MDRQGDLLEVHRSERGSDSDSVLLISNPWYARELELTPDKVEWLWKELQQYRTLFSDVTRNRRENFEYILEDPYSYWLEIKNLIHETVGIFYVTGLQEVTDAQIHVIFFDRQPSEKAELCRLLVFHIFEQFPGLHRLTVSVPSLYHATIRLAKKIGFKFEGQIREKTLFGGKWTDEVMLGILASEVIRGSD